MERALEISRPEIFGATDFLCSLRISRKKKSKNLAMSSSTFRSLQLLKIHVAIVTITYTLKTALCNGDVEDISYIQ